MPIIYDISVPIADGGVVYPGNPAISIASQQAISQGGSSNVSSLAFGSHTGTHVDAPKHFFDDGETVDNLALDVLMGPAMLICVDATVMAVGKEHLSRHQLKGHSRILIQTRNSRFIRGGEFIKDYTYLARRRGVSRVARRDARGRGLFLGGAVSLEVSQNASHAAGRGIIIVEDSTSPATDGPYQLCVLPLKLAGLDGAPARPCSSDDGDQLVLFDIGGVLGSNGWDREQRSAAIDRFALDAEDFQYRHEETVGAWKRNDLLGEYLDVAVFCSPRGFTREFKAFMFCRVAWRTASPSHATSRSGRWSWRRSTMKAPSERPPHHVRPGAIFPTFFTSCWLGVRKPTHAIYTRVGVCAGPATHRST
jgi:arylformamidase